MANRRLREASAAGSIDLEKTPHMQFQRLIVLPLNLQLCLELLDEQIEPGNFSAQPLGFWIWRRWTRNRRCVRLWSSLVRSLILLQKGFRQSARPHGIG